MLELKGITKTFGKIKALEDINFNVEKGEFVFITGPSGAGKTTIIRLILRELLPDQGEIILAGRDITKLPSKQIPYLRQKIGTIFQDFKVLPEKTVRENIEMALAVCGVNQEEWKDRGIDVLKMVGLKKRHSLFPSQLSGGELQRLSMARALAINPKIVLADEPTGNLDWDTADLIMDLFQKINSEGRTVIMATHHELIIKKYAQRIIELKEGRVVKDTASKKEIQPKKDIESQDINKSE